MMHLGKVFFFFSFVLIFSGCSSKEYEKQESVFIVFKTATFKHADLGFIYENSDIVKVEIYGSGQALISLEISRENICMNLLSCMSKAQFNKEVLSQTYPKDILEHIFRGDAVFEGIKLTKIRNGFTQIIREAGKYDIHYKVLNKQIIFHDTINNILIKVKRMDS